MRQTSSIAFAISIIILFTAIVYGINYANITGYSIATRIAATPCIDSDAGQDPFTSGYASTIDGNRMEDACINQGSVREAYCNEHKITKIIINCPLEYQCVNNACVPET